MKDHRLLRGFCICVAVLTSFFTAHGQSTTSLRGVITDQTGAIIPGAVVSLANEGTGFKRQSLTGETGLYQFLQTPPGSYQLTVEKPGFAIVTRDSVQLLVNTPGTLDLHMAVGNAVESVNVTADTPVINNVDASIGNAFYEQQVRQLPLDTRNVVELLSLQVGVTPTGEVSGRQARSKQHHARRRRREQQPELGAHRASHRHEYGRIPGVERQRHPDERGIQRGAAHSARFGSGISRHRGRSGRQ